MTSHLRTLRIVPILFATTPLVAIAVGCAPSGGFSRSMAMTQVPLLERMVGADKAAPPVEQSPTPVIEAHNPAPPVPVTMASTGGAASTPIELVSQPLVAAPPATSGVLLTGPQQQPSAPTPAPNTVLAPPTPPRQLTVVKATAANFDQQVLRSDLPVLVDFYADWCGPCKRLAPVLDRLARNMPEAKIVKVNVDENPKLAAQYQVRSLPTLLVFQGGKVAGRHKGLADESQLKRMLGTAAAH